MLNVPHQTPFKHQQGSNTPKAHFIPKGPIARHGNAVLYELQFDKLAGGGEVDDRLKAAN